MSLQNLLASIRELKCEVAETKTVIDSYIANTNEPLEERWQLYQTLPSFLRNHKSSRQNFLVKTDGSFSDIYDFDFFYNNEVVKVHSFIDDYIPDCCPHDIDISATKENILKNNLGSFENNW